MTKEVELIEKSRIYDFRKVMYKKITYEYNTLLQEDKDLLLGLVHKFLYASLGIIPVFAAMNRREKGITKT